MNSHLIRPARDTRVMIDVTPENAGWDYLSFRVLRLAAGDDHVEPTGGNEVALVPLSGRARVTVGDRQFELARAGVFEQKPHILYVPPGHTIRIEAESEAELALGGAPAEGRYPLRLFTPDEMKSEVRGGGAARRQVNHVLAPPLPAERLILYEVYVPGGAWSGWPPHCHDRYGDSPYLEETYYYRITPEDGFAFHRNYRIDRPFDELFTVRDGDLVLVTEGFHPVAVPPGSNIYFLNYLAGELEDEARDTPPYDDPAWADMKEDYERGHIQLPIAQE